MRFSVIIPVYNVEPYLQQSVDSVLAQEGEQFEIILVDDGSTDGSPALCDRLQSEYPEIIRVIHQENKGLLLARRTGIRAASGDWLLHLDSDDYMMPGTISAIHRAIEETAADMVLGQVAYGAKDGIGIDFCSKLPFQDGEVFEGELKRVLYRQLLCKGYMTAIYQKAVRRDVADIEKDYEPYRHVGVEEDMLQSLPLLNQARRIVYLKRPFVYYRHNPESMTRKQNVNASFRTIRSLLSVYDVENAYIQRWGLSDAERSVIAQKHCRRLCVEIRKLMRAAQKTDQPDMHRFLQALRDDSVWKSQLEQADRRKLGRFSRLCYLLLKHDRHRLLQLLCRL